MGYGMSAKLNIQELDGIADELCVVHEGKKPSRAATAFCLALACCACERVPAALFYRACQSRRHWLSSGELVDSCDHLEELPSWLLGLFRVQKAELSAGSGTWISLELLGIRPDDVQAFGASEILLPSDLQYLSDLQGFSTITLDDTTYFKLAETWKENILRTASEGLRICIWTLLATVAAYAMPAPYTEPLWPVFQFQLKELIESTVMPFLSVLDLRDIQDWSYALTEDILLLLIHHRFSAGTLGSGDPLLGPEISQYLRTTNLHDGRLTHLILLVDWLEVLVSQSRVSKSNFLTHLGSCSQEFLCDERLKFLILAGVDSAVTTYGCTFSAEIAAELREWRNANLVFAGHDVATISQCLWQSLYKAKDQISVPALMKTNVNVKSALGFTLAERQHYRQAQSVLSACLSDTQDSWPTDSPTRHLILAEFVNSSNLLGDYAQAESAARQAIRRSRVDNRFDITCLKIALADSYIGQCKYKMAVEILTEIFRNTSFSNDVLLRIALRLTKAKRRLAKEAAMPVVDTNLIERFADAQENIPESLKIECLEETLSIVVDATRPLADAFTVREVRRTHEAIQAHLARAPKTWRVDAVREAMDSINPLSFKDGYLDTFSNQRLPQDLKQTWDESPPEPRSVDLPSRGLIIRALTFGDVALKSRVRGLSGPVMYRRSFVPSERLGTGDATSAFSTIDISYQVKTGWSQASNSVDFAVIKSYDLPPELSQYNTGALRYSRIYLRKSGFIGPIVALVSSLDKYNDIIVNMIDGGYGRGYDGYLEEPLERERLALLIRYYCQASDYGITAQRSFPYTPLVFNDKPRMVLLPANYPKSSAFGDPNTTLYSIHEDDVFGGLSLTWDYSRRPLDHSGPFLRLFCDDSEYHRFVVPTLAFRKAEKIEMGYQMVYVQKPMLYGPTHEMISLVADCGKQPHLLTKSETLDVNLTFDLETSSGMRSLGEVHLSSEIMREYQVDTLEISRICIRRIIEHHTRTQTSELIKFFAGTSTRKHGARHLVTGYRTYLNPIFTSSFRAVAELPDKLLDFSGESVAAMQLCEISLNINNVIQPSELDIDLTNIQPKDLDSLQVHVGEPEWHVLWGPMSDADKLWPPSTYGRQRNMEDDGQPDIVKVGSRPEFDDKDFIEYHEGDTYKTVLMKSPNRTSRVLSASIKRARLLRKKLNVD